jgi:hypothetical protein
MMAKALDSAIWMMSERKYMRLVTRVAGWPVSLSWYSLKAPWAVIAITWLSRRMQVL